MLVPQLPAYPSSAGPGGKFTPSKLCSQELSFPWPLQSGFGVYSPGSNSLPPFFFWTAFKQQAEGNLTMHKQSLSRSGRLTTLKGSAVWMQTLCVRHPAVHTKNLPQWLGDSPASQKIVHKRTRAARSAHLATLAKTHC